MLESREKFLKKCHDLPSFVAKHFHGLRDFGSQKTKFCVGVLGVTLHSVYHGEIQKMVQNHDFRKTTTHRGAIAWLMPVTRLDTGDVRTEQCDKWVPGPSSMTITYLLSAMISLAGHAQRLLLSTPPPALCAAHRRTPAEPTSPFQI
jgi:hypothetical protein